MSIEFLIVVPVFNAAPWISRCIRSIRTQTVGTWRCRVIDDASTDGTFAAAQAAAAGDPRIEVVRNPRNQSALANLIDGFRSLGSAADPQAVLVTVDGDDWLARDDALEIVRRAYASGDVWLTYGSFIEHPSGRPSAWVGPFPPPIVAANLFRDYPWQATHLRTFKSHLWHALGDGDLLDPQTGKPWTTTWDFAIMFPMLEIAGTRHQYIETPLYAYNRANALNEDRVRGAEQRDAAKRIRALPRRTPRPYTETPQGPTWTAFGRWAKNRVEAVARDYGLAPPAAPVAIAEPVVIQEPRPLVSVLCLTTMPKRARWLADALLSYQLQTYAPRELVVVNDGTPMRAVAPDVRVVNIAPGLTMGAKRNLAARHARGAFHALWDDDDFSLPERLARQVARAQQTGAATVRVPTMYIADKDLVIRGIATQLAFATALIDEAAFARVEGFPDRTIMEDVELYARFALRSLRNEALREPLYVHRRHGSNVSNAIGHSLEERLQGSEPADVAAANAVLRGLLATPRARLVEFADGRPLT